MPRRRKLTKNQLARLRNPRQGAQLARYSKSRAAAAMFGTASRTVPALEAAHMAYQAAQHATNIYNKTMSAFDKSKHKGIRDIRQTKARTRGAALNQHRNEKLAQPKSQPMNRGKGLNKKNMGPSGVLFTHPNSRIPHWKVERLNKYNNMVYQTVLLSKSNRLPTSNNTLQTTRYPLSVPECLDGERTQTMLFTPFCSHWSGQHTTYFRKVNAAGTALEHDTAKSLDVIQRMADTRRLNRDIVSKVAGNAEAAAILYEGPTPQADVQTAANLKSIVSYKDQLVKHIGLDLVFIASRAFPVEVSVSVVRQIKPAAPYTLTTNETRELCNGVGNHGMDWSTWRTEYYHKFKLPALRVNKKPPHYNIKKTLKTNFIQTNTFNENTTSQDMAQASQTSLGSNIHSTINEVADGNMSGNFYVLIKYRKVQEPQQFTYTQTVISNPGKDAKAEITIPMVSEQSFDIPGNAYRGNNTSYPVSLADNGATTSDPAGQPLEATTNNIREDRAHFFINGKLTYGWGFKEDTEPIPSLVSEVVANGNYKKLQALNIDPSLDINDDDYGIYTQSPDHVQITPSTATGGT